MTSIDITSVLEFNSMNSKMIKRKEMVGMQWGLNQRHTKEINNKIIEKRNGRYTMGIKSKTYDVNK